MRGFAGNVMWRNKHNVDCETGVAGRDCSGNHLALDAAFSSPVTIVQAAPSPSPVRDLCVHRQPARSLISFHNISLRGE